MIIDEIDIVSVALFEAKGDAPVRSYRNAPKTFEIALEWMSPKPGNVICFISVASSNRARTRLILSTRAAESRRRSSFSNSILRPRCLNDTIIEKHLRPTSYACQSRWADVLLDRGPFAIDFLTDILPTRLNPTAALTGQTRRGLQKLRTVRRESRSIRAIRRIECPCSDRVLI